MEAVLVDIQLIRISEKRQKGISLKRVEEFRRAVERDEEIFPVRLCALGDGTYTVKDGRHRIAAYKAAGCGFVLAIIENLKRIPSVAVHIIRRALGMLRFSTGV